MKKITVLAFIFVILFGLCISGNIMKANDQEYFAIVLFDPNGSIPQIAGHIAILLGNEQVGYSFYSKSKFGNENQYYKSVSSFRDVKGRYTQGYQIKVDEVQFKMMSSAARSNLNRPYYTLSNNCNHFVYSILSAANLYAGDPNVRPVVQYEAIKSGNSGMIAW